MATDRTILVTGATGRQGGAIARELLQHGHSVRAMTRKPESDAARALAELGAEVVVGNLDDADSLRRALDGVWGVLSVQNWFEAGAAGEEEQGKRLARLAREAGVQHFVYQSVGSAHRSTGIPHFDSKWRIEETVRALGFPSYTILRPVFFMENLLGSGFKPGIDRGILAIALRPETRLQMIAVSDIGLFGLRAFEDPVGMNGREIDIAGDACTGPEMAAALSRITGREIRFHQVPLEDARSRGEDYARMMEWFDTVGYEADIAGLEEEFGIELTRFEKWAAEQDWTPAK